MKKLALAAAASVLAVSSANAAVFTVDGITFDTSFVNLLAGTSFETNPTQIGDVLNGVGRISSIEDATDGNPLLWQTGDNGRELTYRFDNFVLAAVGVPDPVTGNLSFGFTGGTITFYSDASPDFDADNIGTATDGSVWLTLAGAPAENGFSLFGAVNGSVNGGFDSGFANGLLSVVGNGAADAFFDTNTFFGGADFAVSSSFNPTFGVGVFPLSGTSDFRAQPVSPVPEPASWAMMLAGFGAVGYSFRARKRRSILQAV